MQLLLIVIDVFRNLVYTAPILLAKLPLQLPLGLPLDSRTSAFIPLLFPCSATCTLFWSISGNDLHKKQCNALVSTSSIAFGSGEVHFAPKLKSVLGSQL